MPQLPQFCASESVLTQAPFEHWVSGELHWQREPAHCSRPEQVFPQPPQLARSVTVSTHVPLQLVSPPVQPARQTPAWQAWPEGHAVPHAPQLAASVWTFTHCPLHRVVPVPQGWGF